MSLYSLASGEMRPADDNETIDECKSNWGGMQANGANNAVRFWPQQSSDLTIIVANIDRNRLLRDGHPTL